MSVLPLLLLLVGCGAERDVTRGRAALDEGDMVRAEAAFRAALDREPGHPEALYGLGWTWHLAGQTDEARTAFEQLRVAHPESPLGYRGLGSVAMAEGNLPAARRSFQAALERAPGDLEIRHSLALVDLSARNGEAAAQALEALCAEVPERGELHQARAEALLLVDRGEDALAAADLALARSETPRSSALARLTRARVLLSLAGGRVDPADCAGTAPPVYAWLEEADRMLDEAVALQAGTPELTSARQTVLRRRGHVDDLCPGLRTGARGKAFPDG